MTQAAAAAQQEPKIRPAEAGDIAFISSTWLQSFWRESPWANRLRWAVFREGHSKITARLLERSGVLVACDPEHPEEIVGYLVYEYGRDGRSSAVHFAYVKPPFRRSGVLRALLAVTQLPRDLAGVAVTHGTRTWFGSPPLYAADRVVKAGKPGIEEKFPKAVHDPYRWMEA